MLLCVLSIATSGFALLLQNIVDLAVGDDIDRLLLSSFVALGLLVVFAVVQTLVNVWLNVLIFRTSNKLQVFLYDKILNKNSISNYNSGDLLSRAYVESPSVCLYAFVGKMRYINSFFEIVLYVSILSFASWLIAIIVVILVPVFFLLLHKFNKKVALTSNEINIKSGISQSVFLGMFRGFATLKIFRREGYNLNIFEDTIRKKEKQQITLSKNNGYFQTFNSMFRMSLPVLLAVLTAYFFSVGFVNSLGAVILVYMLANYIVNPLLDEPTSALDSDTSLSVIVKILQYAKQNNSIVLCVSHDQKVVELFDKKYNIVQAI